MAASLPFHSRDVSPIICHDTAKNEACPFQKRHEVPTKAEKQKKPWKYAGYNVFSRLMASDEDFLVVRRFGHLRARLLLRLQDSVVRLEEELESIDLKCSEVLGVDFNNGSFREEPISRRLDILQELSQALQEYDDLVLRSSKLWSLPQANNRNVQNLENWFIANPGAINSSEAAFIEKRDDLISIVPKIKSPLRRLLERISSIELSPLFRIQPSGDFYDPELVYYHSDKRIETCMTTAIIATGFLMLITPLWILVFIPGELERLAIITSFVALFIALMASVTVAKPFETLAATAAYTAVLMVFMQTSTAGSSH